MRSTLSVALALPVLRRSRSPRRARSQHRRALVDISDPNNPVTISDTPCGGQPPDQPNTNGQGDITISPDRNILVARRTPGGSSPTTTRRERGAGLSRSALTNAAGKRGVLDAAASRRHSADQRDRAEVETCTASGRIAAAPRPRPPRGAPALTGRTR